MPKMKPPEFDVEEVPGIEAPDPAPDRETALADLIRPLKKINMANLLLSGRYLHSDNEAAAFQRMSPGWFSKMMKKRDKASGLIYREIFVQARAGGRAGILRRAHELMMQDRNPSAAVTMAKFVLANELGWSEKRVDEQKGTLTHHHTHQAIPSDEKMREMSDQELATLAAEMGNGGKRITRH